MTNTNRQIIQTIQKSFVDTIKYRLETKGHNLIDFKNPFRIYMDEQVYYEDYIRIPWGVRSLFKDGSVIGQNENGEEGSFALESLDVYDLAYIMDVLESGEYTVDDEEFIDPAGGRGLQSHI